MGNREKFETNEQLVEYLKSMGFPDNICSVFDRIDRKDFVLDPEKAYYNTPLEIYKKQTTSQPLIIAIMLRELELTGEDVVLEIGTGSGYQTAMLSYLCRTVHTIEIHEKLAEFARTNLAGYNRSNIIQHQGNALDYDFKIKFDRIIVSACCMEIPDKLQSLLNTNGILLIPVYRGTEQFVIKVVNDNGILRESVVTRCRFVMFQE